MSDGVVFRLLGPVEVSVAGHAVRLPRLERHLAALLALDAGRLVPLERIVDVLWGQRPPDSVHNRVQAIVSGLRRCLGEAGRLVVTEAGSGYRLGPTGYQVDVQVFDLLVGKARELSDRGQPAAAAAAFREATALWRGTPLANIAGLDADAVRLAEARMVMLCERFDLELALGRQDEVIGELGALAIEHPTREPLTARWMLALYRSGRQAEALEAFARARAYLVGELGVEPGAELAGLHERILRQDPALDLPAAKTAGATGTAGAAVAVAPAQLPRDVPDFTGRRDEVRRLLSLAETGQVVAISAIDGMAGIGKTALAVHVAHRLMQHFPHGHLYLDLRAHAAGADPVEPGEALDFLLRSIGVAQARIPDGVDERAALWRTEIARLRALIILDNAVGADQVRPLLPGTGGSFVLVTSRHRLTELEGGHSLHLDLLPAADAVALFETVAGARVALEPQAVAEVVELCGRLPLAIRVAAARLRGRPQWTVGYLAERLRQQHRLAELCLGDNGVEPTLALSYQDLGPPGSRLFRLLGPHPGDDFDAYSCAALAGIPVDEADLLLESLLDMHLLMPQAPGRYRFHDLIREFALAMGDRADDDRPAALDRVFDYYLHTVNAAGVLIEPTSRRIDLVVAREPEAVPPWDGAAGALSWLDAERTNLVAAVHHACLNGRPGHAWQLVYSLRPYHSRKGRIDEIRATYRSALMAAEAAGDVWAQAQTANGLGTLMLLWERHEQALDWCRRALHLYREAGDRYGVAGSLVNLGGVLTSLKRVDEALDHLREGHDEFREIGDDFGQASALGNIGDCLTDVERYPEALDHLQQSLAICHRIGYRVGEATVLGMIGRVHHAMKNLDAAIVANEQARVIHKDSGHRNGEAARLIALGGLYRDQGKIGRGRDCFEEALAIGRHAGNRLALSAAHERLGDLLAAEGDHGGAASHWRQAIECYTELDDPKAMELAGRVRAMEQKKSGSAPLRPTRISVSLR